MREQNYSWVYEQSYSWLQEQSYDWVLAQLFVAAGAEVWVLEQLFVGVGAEQYVGAGAPTNCDRFRLSVRGYGRRAIRGCFHSVQTFINSLTSLTKVDLLHNLGIGSNDMIKKQEMESQSPFHPPFNPFSYHRDRQLVIRTPQIPHTASIDASPTLTEVDEFMSSAGSW